MSEFEREYELSCSLLDLYRQQQPGYPYVLMDKSVDGDKLFCRLSDPATGRMKLCWMFGLLNFEGLPYLILNGFPSMIVDVDIVEMNVARLISLDALEKISEEELVAIEPACRELLDGSEYKDRTKSMLEIFGPLPAYEIRPKSNR